MTGCPDLPPPNCLPAPHARALLAVRGNGFGAEAEATLAADATALSLIALLVFCVTCIAISARLLRKRLGKQGPPREIDTADAAMPFQGMDRTPAWQKPEDWWKH